MNASGFLLRSAAISSIRSFFDGRGFIEVDTPVRIAAPAPEPHIDCPPVATGGFLRASPELQMKKLLAAGLDKIYQIGPCFRDGEYGRRHRGEFTMLEWYRKNASYLDIASDTRALLGDLFRAHGREFSTRIVTVRGIYGDIAGWDPWTAWDADRFDYDMAVKIEPAVKDMGSGVFLFDYPPPAASLSRLRGEGADAVAERWEFYFDGVELANCFSELADAGEQARRFDAARAERAALGEADYPLDADFLDALSGMGECAGVALGVDRLLMALTGAGDISEVRMDDAVFPGR